MKELAGLLSKLADNDRLTFVLLFLGGLLLFAGGALGGWPERGILIPDVWRVAAGAVGGLLLLAALALLFRGGRGKATPAVDRSGLVIQHPPEGALVRIPCPVSGVIERIPEGAQLWLLTIAGQGNDLRYYPQNEVRLDAAALRWTTELGATSFKSGESRRFAIFSVGENGLALIRLFKAAGAALNAVEPAMSRPWTGLTALTTDMQRCGPIRHVTLQR